MVGFYRFGNGWFSPDWDCVSSLGHGGPWFGQRVCINRTSLVSFRIAAGLRVSLTWFSIVYLLISVSEWVWVYVLWLTWFSVCFACFEGMVCVFVHPVGARCFSFIMVSWIAAFLCFFFSFCCLGVPLSSWVFLLSLWLLFSDLVFRPDPTNGSAQAKTFTRFLTHTQPNFCAHLVIISRVDGIDKTFNLTTNSDYVVNASNLPLGISFSFKLLN